MDYQATSSRQKRPSPKHSNSYSASSRRPISSTSESASIRYYTALANSSTPYESPYAQDTQPPTNQTLRASTTSIARSPSVNPAYIAPSPPTKESLSTYSSSSGGSLYPSSTSRQEYRSNTPGTMSSSKTMSSVSHSSGSAFVTHSLCFHVIPIQFHALCFYIMARDGCIKLLRYL